MTIQEIKERLSMEQVLAHYGLKPNRNQHINCPFHDDKTPSMKVYKDTNTVYCFSGNCRTHGRSLDVIDFVMQQENCSKHEALLQCKAWLGEVPQVRQKLTLAQVYQSYQNGLSQTRKAQAYAEKRGLDWASLELGYNSGQLHHGKPAAFVRQLEGLGLLSQAGNRRRIWGKGCLLFPLRNQAGQIVSLYGRRIQGQGHYYLSGRSGLYPQYLPPSTKRIILTESVIDAATLHQLKPIKTTYEVLALYGTNGLTKEHQKHLQSLPQLKEIVLLLDGDTAGQAASQQHQKTLQKLLPPVNIRIVQPPENTDVNELWANHLDEQLFVELLQAKATPAPKSKPQGLDTSHPYDLRYTGKTARYAIKGGLRLKKWDSLKVTLVTTNSQGRKYRHKIELYEDPAVQKYCQAASKKLKLTPEQIDLDLALLTDALEAHRATLAEKPRRHQPTFTVSAAEQAAAQDFLRQAQLLPRLNEKIGQTGIVGEESNRLLLLLVASSYKQTAPLHALIQGSTGSGKTLLLRKVMQLLPPTDRHIWTRITDKSLYHAGDQYQHQAIAVEDWDGLSEEVQYVLRELQSGQILRSSTTEKQANGELRSREITAKGPISSLLCTTQGSIYEDNMSRCFLIAVDESEAQTDRILNYQYRQERGEIDPHQAQKSRRLIQVLVEQLQPCPVVNPYAGKVRLPKSAHKIRRLNSLYQTFVQQVAWWHQYQRQRDKAGRIIVAKSDLKAAIHLLFETILLKVDELDGSLRQFFEWLKSYLEEQEEKSFTQRQVRQAYRLSKTGCQNYINNLLELEYIERIRIGRRNTHHYQISYWDNAQKQRQALKDQLNKQLKKL